VLDLEAMALRGRGQTAAWARLLIRCACWSQASTLSFASDQGGRRDRLHVLAPD